MQALGKVPAHGHDLANRLHGCREQRVCARKLLKGKAGDFGDDVVDARLKTRRRAPAGNLVSHLVKPIANGQLGRDLGDGKAGGFRGQGRGAADAWVHFDHHQPTVLRIDRKLHIRAARIHANFTQYGKRGVA